jgi:predicted ATPase/DNA-binding SARP family transcriptional activator
MAGEAVRVTTELTLLSGVSYRGRDVVGRRVQDLLALLARDLRAGCSTARLVEGLWPDRSPEHPAKALQGLVFRARSQLGPQSIVSTPLGYRLSLSEDRIDACAVLLSASASARAAREGDHAAALAHAEAGLALWDGVPDGDDGPLALLRAERASTHRALVRVRALALSRSGRGAEVIEALADLALERPRDEELLLELLRCEAAAQGPAAALARYDAYRRALREELGTDPGAALQAEHQRLLRGEETPARTGSARQLRVAHGPAHEPNPLLGRDEAIAEVATLLHTSRVTSIVGPGGLGKTRLAHAVSRRAGQHVAFVALAGVAADDDVAREVASALGAGESRRGPVGHAAFPRDVLGGIVAALGPGPALLVLDNCEHVVRGVADLVAALVSASRDLRVLTTSRAPLGLSSESVYPLPELTLPTCVELFGQRARAVRPGVDLPAGPVAELCRHLDGLPLAVELAAARVRVMSVAEITRRLQDRFALLRGGPRDAPARHRTLHAVVDWSWTLLEPDARAAMRALSVFPAGFTADAARRVLSDPDGAAGDAGGDVDGDVLAGLERLVDQSLLQVTDTPAGTRFWMLETVREFSTARRDEAGESERVTDRFLAWARGVGTARHESPFGPDPYACVELIRGEQDNLLHALRRGIARDDGATVAATSALLGALWTVESDYPRLATLADEAAWILSHLRPEPALVEVTRTALTLITAQTFLVEGPRAVRSLVALRRLPAAPATTVVRAAAAVLCAVPADPLALRALCDSEEPLVAGVASAVASYVWENDGDLDGALKATGRLFDAFDERRAPWMRSLAHGRASELCLQGERGEEARRHLTAGLRVAEQLGARSDVAGMQWWLVLANLQLGDVDEAERWLDRAAPEGTEEAIMTLTYGLGVRAEILLARGRTDAGLDLWRRVVDRLDTSDDPAIRRDPPGLDPWVLEARAVTVTAHARHRRLDAVQGLAGDLPRAVSELLTNPFVHRTPFIVVFPICGALLLALATVDLERGRRDGDARSTTSGVRLAALAERFGHLRGFQPTMSSAGARQAAGEADPAAYADAVSAYAALDRDGLRAAALALLSARLS